MDGRETYEIMKAAFSDALSEAKTAPRIMRVDPFEAEDDLGDPVRVIGVYDNDNDDDMRFIGVCEDQDGMIYPVAMRTLYRRGTAARNGAQAA
ncbi:hypothetical protein FY136_06215 [Agrobacterium tumefaciens]|uniref:hypothetical protein n=1 Tax=Agrobacterium tumefaciens TaxID=358 RepID=UPI0021D0D3DC|nr:hypothetical protein [Agrobacterium tumefaciens]UXT48857.1 hypothetical protein FY136_06215 [Agrobacterium tumefaciens]